MSAGKKAPAKKGNPPPPRRIEKIPDSNTQKPEASFYIVGMGASAGGLDAFERFFQNMPNDSGMAFVLVSHLDPKHPSLMPELIQKKSSMPVLPVKDGTRVMPNTVYIIPPNHDLAILNGVLQLMAPSEMAAPRMPIDCFFRSLAQDQGEKAVCIVLSGMGSDGTLGLRAIKAEMGMVMVQSPESTRYDSMPKRAVATGLVDYVLTSEEMPEKLMAYAALSEKVPSLPKLALRENHLPEALQKVFVLLRSQTGHDFSGYKQSTICRRVERRMTVHQIEKLDTYVRYLQKNPSEGKILFKELLIGVTNFFRDKEAFESLQQTALPSVLKDRNREDTIRVWVPGCSTGEEAYSMAILLHECAEQLSISCKFQVFATDMDERAIEIARQGVYPAGIALDVERRRLKRFFIQQENTYRIRKDIREMLVFAPHDIIKDPPFTRLDLVSCRNLLIYLDGKLQKRILPLFHYSLNPGGILFLGTSESIGEFTDLFTPMDKKWKIFQKGSNALPRRKTFDMSYPTTIQKQMKRRREEPLEYNISQTEKALLDAYAPRSAIIDGRGQVLYIHGRTGRYLEPSPGGARPNLFSMAREGLKLELSVAVRQAISRKTVVTSAGLQVKTNGGFQPVNITVTPLNNEGDATCIVSFEEVQDKEGPKKGAGPKKSQKTKKNSDILKKELQHTRETLQITTEELETANEELKSTNEELQSTNEELQSTVEELETAKEEQQSMNEELTTVNTEMEGKLIELTSVNNDMKNLLDSVEIPTIFLNRDLRIKRFTSHASKVIKVIDTDLGRPMDDIGHRLKYENIIEDAEGVLRNLVYREREVQTQDGHWYLMRVLPYRTVDNVIDGVVLLFLDIHELKMANERIMELQLAEKARQFGQNIIDTIREPFLVLDHDLSIVTANRSFYKAFQVIPEETLKRHIYDLGNGQWNIPALRKLLEDIIPESSFFENFEVIHDFPNVGKKRILLNARRVVGDAHESALIFLVMEEKQ